jgi:Ca2+-binding EF-hand superfamily protein
MRWVSWLCALAPAVLLALPAGHATAAPKKDPAGTALIMGQLRLVFATWDLNGDGYLDRHELAKAFRGAEAKPYHRPKEGVDSPPDFAKYPDYALLIELDVNGDGRISKDEFESWARDYAVALKHQEQAQKKIATAEHKLTTLSKNSSKMTPKELAAEQKAIEADLKKEQEALKKLSKVYDKHFQQAMKQGTKK